MVTPVRTCAVAAAVMTLVTSGVNPAAPVMTLIMPARMVVPPMPSSMSRTNIVGERIGLVDEAPGSVELEVEREDVRRVVPGRGDEVERVPGRRPPRPRAPSRPRPGTVRSTSVRMPQPRAGAVSSRTARSMASAASKASPGTVALQLEVADEDVLVDERRPEDRPRRPGRGRSRPCPPAGQPRGRVPASTRRPADARSGRSASPASSASVTHARTASVSAPSGGARAGTRPGVRDSFGAIARHEQGSLQPVVLDRDDHVAGMELRVLHDVGDAVDPAHRDLAVPQQVDHLVGRPRTTSRPRSPRPAPPPARRGPCSSRSVRVVGEVVATDRPEQGAEQAASCSQRCRPAPRRHTRRRSSGAELWAMLPVRSRIIPR